MIGLLSTSGACKQAGDSQLNCIWSISWIVDDVHAAQQEFRFSFRLLPHQYFFVVSETIHSRGRKTILISVKIIIIDVILSMSHTLYLQLIIDRNRNTDNEAIALFSMVSSVVSWLETVINVWPYLNHVHCAIHFGDDKVHTITFIIFFVCQRIDYYYYYFDVAQQYENTYHGKFTICNL